MSPPTGAPHPALAPDSARPADTGRRALTLPADARTVATELGGEIVGDTSVIIRRPGTLDEGDAESIGFIRSDVFARRWPDSACGAALVTRGIEVPPAPDNAPRALIMVPDADEAFVRILAAADPGRHRPEPGARHGAEIHEHAHVHDTAAIAPGCVVSPGAEIASGCILMPGCFVGAHTRLGEGTVLEAGAVVDDRCVVGRRCIIGANAVIGADGFGYLPPTASRHAIKVPQIGRVVLGDDVEIGACVTIDRAKFGETRVGNRVKLDNQVHVGHNVTIGDDTVICGRATLGGSCTIGARAMIGGAVTVNDQSSIGDDARVAGGAIVLEPVPPGEAYAGIPAMPARQALANYGVLREIAPMLRKLDKRLKALEQHSGDD